VSSRVPGPRLQTFFRQSEDEAGSLPLTCVANELLYGDLDHQALHDFAERVNARYGQAADG